MKIAKVTPQFIADAISSRLHVEIDARLSLSGIETQSERARISCAVIYHTGKIVTFDMANEFVTDELIRRSDRFIVDSSLFKGGILTIVGLPQIESMSDAEFELALSKGD